MKNLALTINGKKVTATIESRLHLGDFLRERELLTATHLGCEHGVCGACTVLLDGKPVRSCITLAVACEGRAVTTLEGLENDPTMVELRDAFSAEHALQCGFCSPGMLISARDLVLRKPDIDDRALRIEMSGNLCRCTGYLGIVRAVRRVLDARRKRKG
jgi:carbon-monoxide dehydrogenase small subunit